MAQVVLWLFVCLYLLVVAVRLCLDLLNLAYIRKRGGRIPCEISDFIEEASLVRANEYTFSKTSVEIVEHLFQKALILIFILSGLFSWYAGLWAGNGIVLNGLLFFAGLFIVSFVLDIPFGYYNKFIVEEKYGFNMSTIKTWVADLFKGLLVSVVIGGLLLLGILLLIKFVPDLWWLIAWGMVFLFSLFLILIYPVFIAPLFNKFTPVEGPLALKLVTMAERAGIKVSGVFQMDASKRSRHSNAYFTGVGKTKRIVLFDTLIFNHPEEEILAIMAHEIGHWKKKHVIKLFLISQIATLAAFIVAAWAIKQHLLYKTFGLPGYQIYAGLFIIMVIFEIPAFFASPISNAFSRRFEREADAFAVCLISNKEDMGNSLKRLAKDNLTNLFPHPLYVAFFYSHPPILTRLKLISGRHCHCEEQSDVAI